MVRNVLSRAADRVDLGDHADAPAERAFQASDRRRSVMTHVEDEDFQYIGDGTARHGDASVHIGFTEPKLGIGRYAPGREAPRDPDRRARRAAAVNIRIAVRPNDRQGALLHKVRENQPKHSGRPRIRTNPRTKAYRR